MHLIAKLLISHAGGAARAGRACRLSVHYGSPPKERINFSGPKCSASGAWYETVPSDRGESTGRAGQLCHRLKVSGDPELAVFDDGSFGKQSDPEHDYFEGCIAASAGKAT